MRSIVEGVGINDADYETQRKLPDGTKWRCPFYVKWASMLRRCYNKKIIPIQPTYEGCSVCDDWLTFTSFKYWMESKDWVGKDLDKDLLSTGNKVYSPDFCVFIDPKVNSFITESNRSRGKYPIGVSLVRGRYVSKTQAKYLGSFTTPEEAHKAWKDAKHKIALDYAEKQTDERVAQALRVRYA